MNITVNEVQWWKALGIIRINRRSLKNKLSLLQADLNEVMYPFRNNKAIYRKSNFASKLLLWLHKVKGEKQLGAAADTKIQLHAELPPLIGYRFCLCWSFKTIYSLRHFMWHYLAYTQFHTAVAYTEHSKICQKIRNSSRKCNCW